MLTIFSRNIKLPISFGQETKKNHPNIMIFLSYVGKNKNTKHNTLNRECCKCRNCCKSEKPNIGM